jgi:hypothetical protein
MGWPGQYEMHPIDHYELHINGDAPIKAKAISHACSVLKWSITIM